LTYKEKIDISRLKNVSLVLKEYSDDLSALFDKDEYKDAKILKLYLVGSILLVLA
jgi:hypothetical protein